MFENTLNWWQKPLSIALLCSLLLHVGFLLVRIGLNTQWTEAARPEEHEPIIISEIPHPVIQGSKSQSNERQIVESEKADNSQVDPNTKYMGEQNQVAEKEQRAKLVDDFRTKQGTGLKNENTAASAAPPTGAIEPSQAQTNPLDVPDGIGATAKTNQGVKRDWKTLSLRDLSVGGDGGAIAATDDRLNGVEAGERTLLSTREFKYYSYYHRIKELLRQYWKPNVERQLGKFWETGRRVVGDTEVTTRLMVLLNPQGRVEKISRMASSGITEIDNAAIEAFNQAAPFPNPPKGMLDPDGFVRIRWDFILQMESAPRIQFQTTRGPATPGSGWDRR